MLIRVLNPGGMAPSVKPAVLGESMAQLALDCLPGRGVVAPLREPSAVAQPTKAGEIRSIFPYGGKWFNWISDVDVCRSPIAQDQWNRVYFTGGTAFRPQMTGGVIATSGGDYPAASYDLGIPAPEGMPGAAVTGTATDEDPTMVETRAYVYTYVSAMGEEGPPSPPSPLVEVAPGQGVSLSGMDTAPAGAYNIAQKRIYRTNTGSSGTEYQLVATIAVDATSYADAVVAADLGSVLPSEGWDPPPEDLHSLIALPCGAFAGLSGNELCFSEPYLPHAWPTAYRLSFDADGVALGAFGNNILVTTQGVPYVVAGSHPSAMTPERLEEGYACVSKRGMVDMGYALIYPAANGLMLAGMGQIRLLTKDLIDQRDWAALAPETIHAYLWDGKYVAFWTNGSGSAGFVFDPATGTLSYHTIAATAGYHDPMTGALYLVTAAGIATWNSGAQRTGRWKSKLFKLPYPANMACGQVLGDGYPVTVRVWADGALKSTRTVSGSDPFRLPSGFRPGSYEIEIEAGAPWMMLALATSMQELATT